MAQQNNPNRNENSRSPKSYVVKMSKNWKSLTDTEPETSSPIQKMQPIKKIQKVDLRTIGQHN